MSFGYAVGDFVLLTQLAWRTLQNARRASGEHDKLAREASSLHIVLQRLETEVSKPHSILNTGDDDRIEELATLAGNCERVANVLLQILEKYNALSEEKKRVTKLWKRVQFGNGEMQDLSAIRLQLSAHTNAITLFLNLLSIGSQGNVEQEGSILTSYADDDKSFWKELRRELVKEGYSSEVLRRHKTTIMNYVHELGAIGALDELPYDEPQLSPEVAQESKLNSDAQVIAEPSSWESRDKVPNTTITDTELDEREVVKAENALGPAIGGAVAHSPYLLRLGGARSSSTGLETGSDEVEKSYEDPGGGGLRQRQSEKDKGNGYDGPKHVRPMNSRAQYPSPEPPPQPPKTIVDVAPPPSTPSTLAGSRVEQGRTQAKVLDRTRYEFWKERIWISQQRVFEDYLSASSWIDDITVRFYGSYSPEAAKSLSFKSTLNMFISKTKRLVHEAPYLVSERDKEIVDDVLESAHGLWAILKEKLRNLSFGIKTPISILSQVLSQLEEFGADIELWNSKSDQDCKDIELYVM